MKSKRLFKNRILESLSRTHVAVPITFFFLYSIALMYWNFTNTTIGILESVGLFTFGFIFFTWVEYLVHRYVFHLARTTPLREKVQHLIHGIHHEFPKDKTRLAMPPVISITLSVILFFLFKFLLNGFIFSFFAGFLFGYSFYLWVHYMVHVFQPPKNFLKVLWVNHAIHHYKDDEKVFGVSSPFWDYIYGTNA